MTISYQYIRYMKSLVAVLCTVVIASSCKKDGNPNNLPSVSTASYEGKIDGYSSSSEVFPENLIAYWSFDDTKNETISGTAPTTTQGDAFVTGGVKGKALSLTAGFMYYATQFQRFKTDSLKSWTISAWIKMQNNGSKRTMLFQLARVRTPATIVGNINFILNTNAYAATNPNLQMQPTFATVGDGTQDNLNNVLFGSIGADKWTHVLLTYDGTTGVFNNWIDAVKVGAFPNRGIGNSLYKSWEPSEIIIGGNYNVIPGKTATTDVSFV
ncbi:MAG: hypothetical protein JWQ30_5, partial [Sediminibacterium sp.]|nr:hypothetical protein [Sediminibacterium sp.]